MVEFAYNNAKNASITYTPLKLNCGFLLKASYKKDADLRSYLKSPVEILSKFGELMTVHQKNL